MIPKRQRQEVDYKDPLTDDEGYVQDELDSPASKRMRLDSVSSEEEYDVSDEEEQENEDDDELRDVYGTTMVNGAPTSTHMATISPNAHFDPRKTGLMDLPVELRLDIYKLVLVKADCVQFGQRRGFPHSSALLSVNRTLAREAAPILYGMNRFVLQPDRSNRGTYWEERWKWVGYTGILSFLRSIGPSNLGFLKTVALVFQDAAPTDEPGLTTDQRRFQCNRHLLPCVRLLNQYATGLELLKLKFTGRAIFYRTTSLDTDVLFCAVAKLKADVVITEEITGETYSRQSLFKHDVWPNGPNSNSAAWIFEKKLGLEERATLTEKISRSKPLNPSLVADYREACAEEKIIREKREKEQAKRLYGWYH